MNDDFAELLFRSGASIHASEHPSASVQERGRDHRRPPFGTKSYRERQQAAGENRRANIYSVAPKTTDKCSMPMFRVDLVVQKS
jgi:hypothetical protein